MSQFGEAEVILPGEDRRYQITPVFQYITVLDIPKTEAQGKDVFRTYEAVELRIAGDRQYVPVFPVDSMWMKIGNDVITFAERYGEQYRAWKNGDAQYAEGTPLVKLSEYGATPSELSICRSLKIYTVEALDGLEGQNLKSLGIHANKLKPLARRYLADRSQGQNLMAENERLRAEIEQLRAANPLPSDADAELDKLPVGYEEMSAEELKEAIAAKLGSRPRGNPSHETLVRLAQEADGA